MSAPAVVLLEHPCGKSGPLHDFDRLVRAMACMAPHVAAFLERERTGDPDNPDNVLSEDEEGELAGAVAGILAVVATNPDLCRDLLAFLTRVGRVQDGLNEFKR